MVLLYLVYIAIMVLNPKLERWSHSAQRKLRKKVFPSSSSSDTANGGSSNGKGGQQTAESTPLHVRNGNAVAMTETVGGVPLSTSINGTKHIQVGVRIDGLRTCMLGVCV